MSHSYWCTTPEWLGETAFLLGCGPSLHAEDVRQLYGRRVIAINDAYQLAPWAEILYFCDLSWWHKHSQNVMQYFSGRRIVTMEHLIHGVCALRCSGDAGLDTDPGAIRHGNNSGYQAIHLAYHLGATRIVLLGYDMRSKNGQTHWRARPGAQMTAEAFQRALWQGALPKFASLVEPLRNAGVEVINCTPGSALTCWPQQDFGKILEQENENFQHIQYRV